MINQKRGSNVDLENPAVVRYKGYSRLVITLIAVTCLSMGIAIGAIVRGVAGAKEDPQLVSRGDRAESALSASNRLSISESSASPDSLSAIFARVALEVEPSVVHIKVTQGDERTVFARAGTGSGVIVNSAGFIITNQHVVGRASKISAKLADGTEYPAKIVGQDVLTDLAVIKIEPKSVLPASRMGSSDKLNVGDWVLAIGSPFGLEQTVTAGIISAKDRIADSRSQSPFQQFLQTDAAINPGNSGGPLVNLAGEVIGINTQIATSSGVYNGIGFALPSSTAVDVYNQLVTNGRVRRGYLGITLEEELKPQIARLNKIGDNEGVMVREVLGQSSPAGRAGIQAGDVIISINGKKVKSYRELIRFVASLDAGSIANVNYLRGGEHRTATVKLEERKDENPEPTVNLDPPPFDPRAPRGVTPEKPKSKPVLGLIVKNLSPELAKQHGLEGVRGVYISSVEIDSVGEDSGVRPDDVLIEINYKAVSSADDFNRITKGLRTGDDIVLKVLRRDRGPLRRAELISFTMP
jgi:serine protease Do